MWSKLVGRCVETTSTCSLVFVEQLWSSFGAFLRRVIAERISDASGRIGQVGEGNCRACFEYFVAASATLTGSPINPENWMCKVPQLRPTMHRQIGLFMCTRRNAYSHYGLKHLA